MTILASALDGKFHDFAILRPLPRLCRERRDWAVARLYYAR
jgi:hypothetical protein